MDTAFDSKRELVVCLFLQDFSKGKGSTLQLIFNAHTALLLLGAVTEACIFVNMHNIKHYYMLIVYIWCENLYTELGESWSFKDDIQIASSHNKCWHSLHSLHDWMNTWCTSMSVLVVTLSENLDDKHLHIHLTYVTHHIKTYQLSPKM